MFYAIVTVIILIIDQAMKYWTSVNLDLGATSPLIPGFVQLTNIHNTGAAFGILPKGRWFFVVLTVVVAVGVIILLSNKIIKGKLGRWMLVMVLAGGIGNCIDRIFNGYVVDMFQFQFKIFGGDFAIFNVSDIFVTVCGIIFCLYLIFNREPEKAPAAVKAPMHAPPAEHVVRADYITQLKKPVVEGRREIEAEIKAMEAEEARENESVVTDWSSPDFTAEKAQEPKAPKPEPTDFAALFNDPAKPSPEKRPQSDFPAAERPQTPAASSGEHTDEPPKPEKGASDEFDIENIIAEFKDK